MAHHIIYIPGLGDQKAANIQIKILKKWQKFGVETHFIPVRWNDDEPYESKLARVLKEIDNLAEPKNTVSLVGVSAGGSMAVNAYISRRDKISGVVFICGKLRNPEGVDQSYFRANPAFKKSVFDSGANVEKLTLQDKAKMLTIRSLRDGTIPPQDSQIPGVKNHTLLALIHVPTIAWAITARKRLTINFLKSQAE